MPTTTPNRESTQARDADLADIEALSGAEWQIAGEAWEHAASDWAYLFEPYARDAVEAVFDLVGVDSDTRLLDVACGAGSALGRASRRGAAVAGLDASAGLLEIAARRAVGADLVHGDMFDLPWGESSFDVVASFNGIWGGCEAALAEMARVCRPGGRIGLTYWGAPERLDLLSYFMTVGAAGPGVSEEIVSLAAINAPGAAELILAGAGFEEISFGTTQAILEFGDDEIAWRALRSPGLVLPSIRHTGEQKLRRQVLEAISPHRHDDGTYRLVNELVHVVARRRS